MTDFKKDLALVRKANRGMNIRAFAVINMDMFNPAGVLEQKMLWLDLYNDLDDGILIGEHKGGTTVYYPN